MTRHRGIGTKSALINTSAARPLARSQAPAVGVRLSGGSRATADVAGEVLGLLEGTDDGAAVEGALLDGVVVTVLELLQPAVSTMANAATAARRRRSTTTSCREATAEVRRDADPVDPADRWNRPAGSERPTVQQ